MMEIKELRVCPEHKDTVMKWMNQEFGTEKSLHFFEGIVNHSVTENRVPITFVAVENGELLGTALQNHVLNYCREQGYQELYLYTDIKDYYEKNNWEKFAVGYEYMGGEMMIYRHML